MSFSWARVATALRKLVEEDAAKPREEQHLDEGQRASLWWMAERLPHSGVVLADEVGTGKTRTACAVVHAVLDAGGRAAVVVPHGLMHQWQKEAQTLGMDRAKAFTSMSDFIGDMRTKKWEEIAPNLSAAEWLLVSHGFRSPRVRLGNKPAEWRVALPSYVRAAMTASHIRNDGRTHAGRLLTNCHESTWKIAQAINTQVHGQLCRNALRTRLDRLPWFNRGGDNASLIEKLQADGRELVEELLGLWLGEFDLLVIDEAHKSRGEVDVEDTALRSASDTVLARLVDALLKQREEGRRLCLTATPMELELSQWLDLLKRARANADFPSVKGTIQNFQKATKIAAAAPDEGKRLDDLMKSSKAFEVALNKFVTRRRRVADKSIQDFRSTAKLSEGLPHPHRRLQRVQIGWTETAGPNSPWLDVLFAAECMNQSAMGLKKKRFESAIRLSGNSSDEKKQKRLKHLIRDMYARLASGHLSADIFDADVRIVPPDNSEEVERGKLRRTEYWRAKIQIAMHAGLHEDEHPRILAAVREIESWTLMGEKVLVFGVFLRSLHLLRDVLNVRHALRAADAGRPIVHAVHSDAALFGIALRQLERLRGEGALSGRLLTGNGAEVCRALADSHVKYVKYRESIKGRTETLLNQWRESPERRWLTEPDLAGGLLKHLVAFLVEEQLGQTTRLDKSNLHKLGEQFWQRHVVEELADASGVDLGNDDEVDPRLERLRETFCNDDNLLMRKHAVLLQGDNRWSTRRYVQAAFNRATSSPSVLIAQSQVGREGLNLHESCRVVVQFHAEWNPAILEQQIGRVDRKGSHWEKLAHQWLKHGALGEPPFIEVRQLIFDGTYDEYQWKRVHARLVAFDAALFGNLLPQECWDRVPVESRELLRQFAPNFRPDKKRPDER